MNAPKGQQVFQHAALVRDEISQPGPRGEPRADHDRQAEALYFRRGSRRRASAPSAAIAANRLPTSPASGTDV